MDIRIQSLKFDADVKLKGFIEKKLSRLVKYNDEIQGMEVNLSLVPDHDNKNVLVKVEIPGTPDIVVERNAHTFEDAVVDCASVLKDLLVKVKEKKKNV
jgi:putative sigma-54 modulation protein